ncbi:type II toxin-antitoxin system RelE/ParE family toxin [Oleomonas cavernae]|uniref:Type II toxin-antitoxin system RelE/ParE family toxin n=1 Tax=Oleomonas cavernae TaxID=2320859 RepID=A0A418WBV1_9PROT|nr:type II toxin-antitoxin system RelE/ParE family toxin [Oleomonas cavernae]RJF87480.1 type II toxin-antitoxin system RelE/ParE family toxin [Oleomonas cavernae]
MVLPRVIRSASARHDLDAIWDRLAGQAGPEIADAVLARIFETMYRAADNPFLYRERPEHTGRPRRVNVFRYAIFFEALPDGDGIFVWRVIHGSRDLPRFIFRPSEDDSD